MSAKLISVEGTKVKIEVTIELSESMLDSEGNIQEGLNEVGNNFGTSSINMGFLLLPNNCIILRSHPFHEAITSPTSSKSDRPPTSSKSDRPSHPKKSDLPPTSPKKRLSLIL